MNNIELKERIELHCHSKYSCNATMYAGEIIRFVSGRKMPYIAIIDTSNIISFPELEMVRKEGNYFTKPLYGVEALVKDNEDSNVYSLSILIKNEVGKQNLYKFLSNSTGGKHTVFDKDEVIANREGLLIGSGAENSKLRKLALNGASDGELKKIICELDYVELLPLKSDRAINERIICLAKDAGKLVVAVSDAHYLEKDDEIACKVINSATSLSKIESFTSLLNTEEMLKAFDYLPEDLVKEIVIDNTYKIAALCEDIHIIPETKAFPNVEGADQRLRDLCFKALASVYNGNKVDEAKVVLETELEILKVQSMSFYPLLMKELFDNTELGSSEVTLRGTSGSSIILYLLGISGIDPLKYNLYPEMIYGKNGKRLLDIDLNVSADRAEELFKNLEGLEGVGKALRSCNIDSYSSEELYGFAKDYLCKKKIELEENEIKNICGKLFGNIKGYNDMPGAVFLFPKEFDYLEVMPTIKLDGKNEMAAFFHFYFDSSFFKTDIYTSTVIDKLSELSIKTGVDLDSVPTCSDDVLELFNIGIDKDLEGLDDLSVFKIELAQNIVNSLSPESFDDLVKIYALTNGTNTWDEYIEGLVKENNLKLKDIPATREDVFEYLLSIGIERALAFDIAEDVRKGKARLKRKNWANYKKEVINVGASKWFVDYCEHVGYLYPRAHAISYMFMIMRLGWYKVHYPKDYASVISNYED